MSYMTIAELQRLEDSENLEGIRKKWKRIRRKVTRVLVPKKLRPIHARVTRFRKAFHRKGRKIGRKYVAPYVVPIAGAILAPFTGGLSLVAAAAITAAAKAAEARKKAKAKYKRGKRAEMVMAHHEAAKYEHDLGIELEKLYNEAEKTHFVPIGYTRPRWKNLTNHQKLSIIKQISEGKAVAVKAGQPPVTKPIPPGVSTPPPKEVKQSEVKAAVKEIPKKELPKRYVASVKRVPKGPVRASVPVATTAPVSTPAAFAPAAPVAVPPPRPKETPWGMIGVAALALLAITGGL